MTGIGLVHFSSGDPVQMKAVQAYGLNFVFAREFIKKEYGADVWAGMLRRMDPADAGMWQEAALEKALPFAVFKNGVNALTAELNSVEVLQLSQMYMHIADRSLSTLYKTFFRLTSPIFVIKNYPRLWEQFFDTGRVTVNSDDRKSATLVFELPEIFLDWLPPACLGYSQKAVDMAGGRYFAMRQLHKIPLDSGDWQISFRLSWQ